MAFWWNWGNFYYCFHTDFACERGFYQIRMTVFKGPDLYILWHYKADCWKSTNKYWSLAATILIPNTPRSMMRDWLYAGCLHLFHAIVKEKVYQDGVYVGVRVLS